MEAQMSKTTKTRKPTKQKVLQALESAGLDSEQCVNSILYSGAGYGFSMGVVTAAKLLER
jgi:hypothetical protein